MSDEKCPKCGWEIRRFNDGDGFCKGCDEDFPAPPCQNCVLLSHQLTAAESRVAEVEAELKSERVDRDLAAIALGQKVIQLANCEAALAERDAQLNEARDWSQTWKDACDLERINHQDTNKHYAKCAVERNQLRQEVGELREQGGLLTEQIAADDAELTTLRASLAERTRELAQANEDARGTHDAWVLAINALRERDAQLSGAQEILIKQNGILQSNHDTHAVMYGQLLAARESRDAYRAVVQRLADNERVGPLNRYSEWLRDRKAIIAEMLALCPPEAKERL